MVALSTPDVLVASEDGAESDADAAPLSAAVTRVPRASPHTTSLLAKQLLERVRAQTRSSVYVDAPLPSFDCDTTGELEYSSTRPFSHVRRELFINTCTVFIKEERIYFALLVESAWLVACTLSRRARRREEATVSAGAQ